MSLKDKLKAKLKEANEEVLADDKAKVQAEFDEGVACVYPDGNRQNEPTISYTSSGNMRVVSILMDVFPTTHSVVNIAKGMYTGEITVVHLKPKEAGKLYGHVLRDMDTVMAKGTTEHGPYCLELAMASLKILGMYDDPSIEDKLVKLIDTHPRLGELVENEIKKYQ